MGSIGWWRSSRQMSPVSLNQIQDHQIVPVTLGSRELNVEIVKTPVSITQGLSNREQLGSDGMLFLLPVTEVPTFWMKDMKFDLDLIWLRDNRIVGISKQVPKPAPAINLKDLPVYSPQESADMVLEVGSGKSDQWSLRRGDLLHFPLK